MEFALVRFLTDDITTMEVKFLPIEQVPEGATFVGIGTNKFPEYLTGPTELVEKFAKIIKQSRP
jgi:hypothetical protein